MHCQLRRVRWCREKLKDMYTGFCKDYPIVTIEDPFDQDDWDATAAFTAEGVCQVCSLCFHLQKCHMPKPQYIFSTVL